MKNVESILMTSYGRYNVAISCQELIEKMDEIEQKCHY